MLLSPGSQLCWTSSSPTHSGTSPDVIRASPQAHLHAQDTGRLRGWTGLPRNPKSDKPQKLSQGSCPQVGAVFPPDHEEGGVREPRRKEPLKTKKSWKGESPEVEPL